MPRKTVTSRTKSKKTKVKVGNTSRASSSASGGFFAKLRTRGGMWVTILAFVAIGALTLAWASAATTSSSLWSNNDIPKVLSFSDNNSVELGVKFQAKYAGQITGMKFYKGAQNTGTHVGSLWGRDGKRLASVTFKNETASGWQMATFSQPIAISANTTYVVSYFAPKGHYALNQNYFTTSRTNDALTAPRNAGVFSYGSRSSFPRDTYKASNYWVDVVFSTKLFNPSSLPAAPKDLTAAVNGKNVALTWTNSVTTGVASYDIARDGTVIANNQSGYIDANLVAGQTYNYKVRAVDAAGQRSDWSNSVAATIAADPVPGDSGSGSTGGGTGTNTGGPTDGGSTDNYTCPSFPDANCTGYAHTGVTLHPCSTPLVAGVPYDSCLFTGEVTVSAANIKVTRSKIAGYVDYRTADGGSLRGLELSDVEIDSTGYQGGATIGNNDYKCTRCNIHGGTRGFNVGYNVTIRDSWSHGWHSQSGDHITGLGSNGGSNNVIDHNTISCDILNDPSGYACSSGLSVYGDDAPGNNNWKITNNLINSGSSYCMVIAGPPSKPYPYTNITVTGNHFGAVGALARGLPASKCTEYGPINTSGPWNGSSTNIWKDNIDANGNQVGV